MKKTLCMIVFSTVSLLAGNDDSFLLRGGTVHPVSGADIPNGAVLVRDGKIVEVGAKVAPPKGVRVIDVRGLHVYPGMIDSATEIGSRRSARCGRPATPRRSAISTPNCAPSLR